MKTSHPEVWNYRLEDAEREIRWFDRLLFVLVVLAVLMGLIGWGAWVAGNDQRALRELRAEQCKSNELAFLTTDSEHVLCISGSQRAQGKRR